MKKHRPRCGVRLLLSACALYAATSASCFALFGSADGYCAERASVICRNMFQCCTSRQIETVVGEENVNDEGKCRRDMEIACRDSYARQLYAVDEGTAIFNKETATKCFDAYNRPDGRCVVMAEKSPIVEACQESPFEGQQGAGEECNWDFECVVDAFCDNGTCKALAKENESCATLRCADGLYCNAGTCAKLKPAGAACTSASECAEDLYCDDECRALLGAGASCESHQQCASADCRTGTCSDGRPCTSSANCEGTCARDGAACTTDYSCSQVCETSRNPCATSADCDTASSEPCVYDTCQPDTCSGRTCAPKALIEVNYCPLS